jgi:formylmethanofuran dehydrogenase subunit B
MNVIELIMNKIILLLIFLCWVSPVLCDDIYIWTDENGVKHFSNAPNMGNAAKNGPIGTIPEIKK